MNKSLTPKKLLVVVDMQNDFINGSLGTPEAQGIVDKVVEKIKDWKGYIVATQDTHHLESYANTLEGKTIGIGHCFEGTIGWDINEKVQAALDSQGSYIGPVNKRTFASDRLREVVRYVENISAEHCDRYCGDCACERDDDETYEERRTRYETSCPNVEVTLIGLCTDICVISNAFALRAEFPNMKITVDGSCCAGLTQEKHKAALDVMNSCEIEVI